MGYDSYSSCEFYRSHRYQYEGQSEVFDQCVDCGEERPRDENEEEGQE